MVELKYRNNGFVSNKWIYNMLRSGIKVNFADIFYQKPNITRVEINWEYMHFGNFTDMLWLSQVFENVNIADTLEWYLQDGIQSGLMQTAHTFNADSKDKLKTKIF